MADVLDRLATNADLATGRLVAVRSEARTYSRDVSRDVSGEVGGDA